MVKSVKNSHGYCKIFVKPFIMFILHLKSIHFFFKQSHDINLFS